MENGLARVGAGVRDDAIAAFVVSRILRDRRARPEQRGRELCVVDLAPGEVALRDHERVEGRDRSDIRECERVLILAKDRRRDALRDDLAEETGVAHPSCATTSGSVERSGMTRVGAVTSASPCRSTNTVRNPSAAAGRMSWYWLAPTWMTSCGVTRASRRKCSQWPGAGL